MFSLEQFQKEINNKGVLHGNRYSVFFTLPSTLSSFNISADISTNVLDYVKITNQLQLRAESISTPGMSFASADGLPPRFGYGAIEGIPYNAIFDPVTITFMMDGHGSIYKYFYEWANTIVNFKAKGQSMDALNVKNRTTPYTVSYKDDFCANKMTIIVYEPNHDPLKSDTEYVMKMNFYRVYPRNLSPFNLAWREQNEYVRFPVTFDYTDFDVEFNDHH
jgi:hypothetical protein